VRLARHRACRRLCLAARPELARGDQKTVEIRAHIEAESRYAKALLAPLAGPNTVVIADDTRRLLGSFFELKDLGPREIKGIAGPARAWAALRPSSIESRFEALHASRLTALRNLTCYSGVGRAKAGEGQVVLLSGEAGIGKSRLTAALVEQLANRARRRRRTSLAARRSFPLPMQPANPVRGSHCHDSVSLGRGT
jgi:hypothetical protein